MKRIAVDMDEVMADSLAEYLARYNADFHTHLTKEDLTGKRIADIVPRERWPRLDSYYDESFFRNLQVMEGSQEVMRELVESYEVYIVTAAMEVPCSLAPKFEWLQQYFPFLVPDHYVFCGNKGIIAADYLIDDSVYQLKRFRGQGVLFTSPRNVLETGYPRVNGWEDVRRMFLSGARPVQHELQFTVD
jgi:5'(3')-deoxyribonucleotidase